MTNKKRKRHTPEQIVKKLRDAEAMLNSGKELAAVLQSLGISEQTYYRWRNQYGGMKATEARRLKELEEENKRLKEIKGAKKDRQFSTEQICFSNRLGELKRTC